MNEDYPPRGNPLVTSSNCLFYTGKICIEFKTLREDKPCEICDLVVMWWKERKKLLATKEGRAMLLERRKKYLEELRKLGEEDAS